MKLKIKRFTNALIVALFGITLLSFTNLTDKDNDVIYESSYSYPVAGITAELYSYTDILVAANAEQNETITVGTSNNELVEEKIVNNITDFTVNDVEDYTMYVGPSIINVRSLPSTDCEILGKLVPGDIVTVEGEVNDDWVAITYKDQQAFLAKEFIQEMSPEEATYNWDWTGETLNRHNGIVAGPSGNETYYNLNMSRCIYYMNLKGYYYPVWIRSDGVKMFGDYVMVAADLSIRPKGSLVETSLGTGIVVDTGSFVNWDSTRLDVAVTW